MSSPMEKKSYPYSKSQWAIFLFLVTLGVLVLFTIGCYLVSFGMSFFKPNMYYNGFIFNSVFTVSNVIGILAVLIAFITLVVGVGAFFGYASLKDVAERKAAEVAEKKSEEVAKTTAESVAKKEAREVASIVASNIASKVAKREASNEIYTAKINIDKDFSERDKVIHSIHNAVTPEDVLNANLASFNNLETVKLQKEE